MTAADWVTATLNEVAKVLAGLDNVDADAEHADLSRENLADIRMFARKVTSYLI